MRIIFTVDKDLNKRLRLEAFKREISKSELIRQMLEAKLKEIEECQK